MSTKKYKLASYDVEKILKGGERRTDLTDDQKIIAMAHLFIGTKIDLAGAKSVEVKRGRDGDAEIIVKTIW